PTPCIGGDMSFRRHLMQLLPFTRHTTRRRGGKRTHSYRPMLEELESRRALSDFSLGALAGRTVHTGDHVEVDDTNDYSFSLSCSGTRAVPTPHEACSHSDSFGDLSLHPGR